MHDTLAGRHRRFPLFEEGVDVSEANVGGVGKSPTCIVGSATGRSAANNSPGTLASARVSAPSSKRGKSRPPLPSSTKFAVLDRADLDRRMNSAERNEV